MLALASGTAALHLVARRARRRARRRGDHDADHLARDRERDRAHRGDTGLRRRARGRPQHRSRACVAEAVTERTKAILPVDLAGQPAELDPLLELGIPIVEDAAHAAESKYRGRKVGAIADVTCFSLYATKNIAAGEGGLIATNRDDVAQAVDDLRLMRRGDGSLYDIAVPGYKANLSDVLASIALCQLDKVERHARSDGVSSRSTTTAVAELAGITPLARDDRDVHALTSTSSASIPIARARRATSTSVRSPRRTSRRRSTSSPCTS